MDDYDTVYLLICLMENIEDHDVFRNGVLEDSPNEQITQTNPFVGVLTEEERQDALMQFSCGETDRGGVMNINDSHDSAGPRDE